MSNLTISIDDDLLKQARMQAFAEGTSVDVLLRDFLEQYVRTGRQYRQVTDRILALAERSTAASQGRRWTRGELYER
jgi:plasmid stability protein